MKIYIVTFDDIDNGITTIIGAYRNKKKAESVKNSQKVKEEKEYSEFYFVNINEINLE